MVLEKFFLTLKQEVPLTGKATVTAQNIFDAQQTFFMIIHITL